MRASGLRLQLARLLIPSILEDPERAKALVRMLRLEDREGLNNLVRAFYPPIAGRAIDLLCGYAINTSPVNITNSSAALFTNNANALSNPMLIAGQVAAVPNPWGIIICNVARSNSATAANTTVNVLNQAGTTVGSSVDSAAASASVGVTVICPLTGAGAANPVMTSFGANGVNSAAATGSAIANTPDVAVAFSLLS
jgi:hypothetical protein